MNTWHSGMESRSAPESYLVRSCILFITTLLMGFSTPSISDEELDNMRLFYSPLERAASADRALRVGETFTVLDEHSTQFQDDVELNTQQSLRVGSVVVQEQAKPKHKKDELHQSIRFDALLTSEQSLSLIVQGVNCAVFPEKQKRRDVAVRCRGAFPTDIKLRYSTDAGLLFVYRRSKLVASLRPGEQA